MRPGKCRACDQPILWVKFLGGKFVPLDPQPVADGNIVVTPDGAVTLSAVSVRELQSRPEGDPRPRYKTHFATCQAAASFRKRKAKAGMAQ